MSKIKRIITLFTALLAGIFAYSQQDTLLHKLSLENLNDFADPPKNWTISGDATADFTKDNDLHSIKGTGAVVNDVSKNNRMHLYTKEEFGDLEVELDFMMAKNSNSGVYLQGRYEIQLLDSWTHPDLKYSDAGGIYARAGQQGPYEGVPPAMNVAKAPGLWQHLHIFFRAPKFNANGEKIKNARFDAVYLNGVLVQQAAFVTGPTTSSMFQDEKPTGPLILQGDHGPVAFKNISYRRLSPAEDKSQSPADGEAYWNNRNPIQIEPGDKPYMLRSFLNFGDKKLTHVISFGYPAAVNFSYDLQTGSIFQIWRGKYLDVTKMWRDRGEQQLAVPLGAVIPLSDAPSVWVLQDEKAAWPDSVAFDSLQHHGYHLDKKRNPLFTYTINGINVSDSIALLDEGKGLVRKISITDAPGNVYTRLASAKKIESISPNLFAVDNKSYYIQTSEKAVIRQSGDGQELIIKTRNNIPFTYSIIW